MGSRSRRTEDVDTIGYRRVSTGEQAADWKTSLQDQTQAIRERAAELGRVLPDAFIFEDRFSGESAEDRAGFVALVEFCRAHPRPRSDSGVALFLNDSRFGRFRDPDEAAYWRFELSKYGWVVRFAENDDTENPTARHVMRSVGGAQASEYLANLKRNARRGTRGAASRGLWQNEAPFGYRRLATAPGRDPVVLEIGQRKSVDQQVRLTPHEGEARLLVWMYETYADGLMSLGRLAEAMRREAPRLRWSKANVQKVLRNRAYLGEVVWCRRPHDKQERRERAVRPRSEWVVTRDAHPALVTPELFERVQARLAKNRRQTRATQGGYPLSGLIRCAQCGRYYVGGGGRRGPEHDPDRFRFYKCSGAGDLDPVCPGRIATLLKRWVEPLVVGEVAKVVESPGVQALIAEEVGRLLANLDANASGERGALEAEIRQRERERDNLVRVIAKGLVSDAEAEREMERIRAAIDRAEQGLLRCRSLREVTEAIRAEGERLTTLAKNFRARAAELSGPPLRELITPWIEYAEYDKETRFLTLTIRRVPAPSVEAPAEEAGTPGGWHGHHVRKSVSVPTLERDPDTGHWRSPRPPTVGESSG